MRGRPVESKLRALIAFLVHDDDRLNPTACEDGLLFGLPGEVRIAELQVFSSLGSAGAK